MRARASEDADRTKRWVCEIHSFDPDYNEPCPRCGKPCRWGCSITIWPTGPVRQGTLHWPMCPCPDDHIRDAVANLLAEMLINDLREHPPEAKQRRPS